MAIRDFLMKRARYLLLVAQNNKADGVTVTPITVVASNDPELLENLIDNGKDRCEFGGWRHRRERDGVSRVHTCYAARTNLVVVVMSTITVV
jgi:hypothetical protein